MRKTDLPAAIVVIAWAYLLWSGIDGVLDIRKQHAPGYPTSGQFTLYIAVPAIMLALLTIVVLARKKPSFRDIYPFAVGFIGFAILPMLGFWGGGV